jgi:hypothetical protein
MKRVTWLLVVVFIASFVGCKKPDESAQAVFDDLQKSGDQTASPETAQLQDATPIEATTLFLESLRTGDEDMADALLTDKAREETSNHSLAVKPPGSDSAVFTIGEAALVGDGAQVNSTWTDVNAHGEEETHEIVWILRQNEKRWRIAGMATRLPGDTEPLILNFEDPADMLTQQELAETRMAERTRESLQQAQRLQGPEDPEIQR